VTRTSATEGEDCAAVFTAALSAYPSCEEKSPGDRVWAGAGPAEDEADAAAAGAGDEGESAVPEALRPEQAVARRRDKERMRAAAQRRCLLMR